LCRILGYCFVGVILLVGDQRDDVLLTGKVLEGRTKTESLQIIHTVRDRDEAVRYLAGDGPYSDRVKHPLPGMIVVDVKVGGLDLVHWILGQPGLAAVPVVQL